VEGVKKTLASLVRMSLGSVPGLAISKEGGGIGLRKIAHDGGQEGTGSSFFRQTERHIERERERERGREREREREREKERERERVRAG